MRGARTPWKTLNLIARSPGATEKSDAHVRYAKPPSAAAPPSARCSAAMGRSGMGGIRDIVDYGKKELPDRSARVGDEADTRRSDETKARRHKR